MNEKELKTLSIGERLKVIGIQDNNDSLVCEIGKVVGFRGGYNSIICVEFDKKFFRGHDCGGRCKNGYGWEFHCKNVEKIGKGKQSWREFYDSL